MAKRSPEQVSKNMSRIRSKDTKPELALRKALWSRGRRYRKNLWGVPGTPDVAFTRFRVAVFCDGDFWHGRDWLELRGKLEVGANPVFWVSKIERNMARDRRNDAELEVAGWLVVRFWASDILRDPDACAEAVLAELVSRGYVFGE